MEINNEPYYLYKYVVNGTEFWTPSLLYATARTTGGIQEVQVV